MIFQTVLLTKKIQSFRRFDPPQWNLWRSTVKKNLRSLGMKIFGSYVEILSIQLNAYFICLSHDFLQIASYLCLTNTAQIFYMLSLSFGIVNRAQVGYSLTLGKHDEAKFKQWFNLF
jgi:Na+-driven multidrug efflux pump